MVFLLIRYDRVCSKHEDFLLSGSILVQKLLNQGYSSWKNQTTFRKFYGRHTDLVHKFDTFVSHMLKVCSPTVTYDWFPFILCKS